MPVKYIVGRTPFSPEVESGDYPEGGVSLYGMALRLRLPDRFFEFGVIQIDGQEVPRFLWASIKPKTTSVCMITFHLSLGKGFKDVIKVVATIALVAIGMFITGGGLAGVLGGAFAAGTFGAAAAAAAISAGGLLLLAAISPAPTANTLDELAAPQATADPAFGTASFNGNILQPGASVPRVLGTRRVFPPFGCEPLVEIVGDGQIAEALYILSGPHQLSALQFGGIDASAIQELQYEIKDALPGSPVQSLITRQARTNSTIVNLSAHQTATDGFTLSDQGTPVNACPQWHTFKSRKDPDELWFAVNFGEGLAYNVDATKSVAAPFRVRFRLYGTSVWVNCPEVHFTYNNPATFLKNIKFKWTPQPTVLNQIFSEKCAFTAFKLTTAQTAVPSSLGVWTAHPYFSAGAGLDYLNATVGYTGSNVIHTELGIDGVTFYLDPVSFAKGTYEVQIQQGTPYIRANATTGGPAPSLGGGPTTYSLFDYYGSAPTISAPVTVTQWRYKASISRVSSVWNENPLPGNAFACIAVKVKNRQLDNMSVLASGYVQDWNGANWTDTIVTTGNPATHYRDIMVGALAPDPIPTDLVDDATLIQWRSDCLTLGYSVNSIIEGKSQLDAMMLTASAGYARPRQSDVWAVMRDKDRTLDPIRQTFSQRNSKDFKWTKAFAKVPDAFLMTFSNFVLNYEEDQVLVVRPGLTHDPVRIEAQTNDVHVVVADVIKRAQFDLMQLQARTTFYSFDTNAQALRCTRGDLVAVQHDVLDAYAGSSEVQSVIVDAGTGLVTGVALDGDLPLLSSGFFTDALSADEYFTGVGSDDYFLDDAIGVSIRLNDNSNMIKQVAAVTDRTYQLNFAVPFAPDANLTAGCLLVTGPLGQEYKRMVILDMAPKQGLPMVITVTVVDEAPELNPYF